MISGLSWNLIIGGICAGAVFILLARNESLTEQNLQLKAQLKALEVSQKDLNAEVELYKNRKIEVIKQVPFKDDSCELELDSYKRLINAF